MTVLYQAGTLSPMNYKKYFREMDQPSRVAHAKRAETSAEYINIHLIPRYKIPRKELMRKLANASEGKVSYLDIVNYFYAEDSAA